MHANTFNQTTTQNSKDQVILQYDIEMEIVHYATLLLTHIAFPGESSYWDYVQRKHVTFDVATIPCNAYLPPSHLKYCIQQPLLLSIKPRQSI